SASTIATTVRDVNNTSPAANSLGADVHTAATAQAGQGATPAQFWAYGHRTLTDGPIIMVVPHQAGVLTIVAGDSYKAANNNAIGITKLAGAAWPADLTGWTVSLVAVPSDKTIASD